MKCNKQFFCRSDKITHAYFNSENRKMKKKTYHILLKKRHNYFHGGGFKYSYVDLIFCIYTSWWTLIHIFLWCQCCFWITVRLFRILQTPFTIDDVGFFMLWFSCFPHLVIYRKSSWLAAKKNAYKFTLNFLCKKNHDCHVFVGCFVIMIKSPVIKLPLIYPLIVKKFHHV